MQLTEKRKLKLMRRKLSRLLTNISGRILRLVMLKKSPRLDLTTNIEKDFYRHMLFPMIQRII